MKIAAYRHMQLWLDKVAPTVQKRQVFDNPVILVEVTEYQAEVKECPNCGKKFRGEFPYGITAPVRYGNNICAIVGKNDD